MRAMTRNIQIYCSGLTVLVTAVMVIVAMVIVVDTKLYYVTMYK